jgi:ketosteroid isomerase-like protein
MCQKESFMSERKIAERPHQIIDRVAEFIKIGDLEGVVSMFHPDCKIVMDPNGKPMEGHDGVRIVFMDLVTKCANLKGTVSGEMINNDTAILQGEWVIEDDEGEKLGGGVSTEVVKRLDHGGWVYYIDCPIALPAPERT